MNLVSPNIGFIDAIVVSGIRGVGLGEDRFFTVSQVDSNSYSFGYYYYNSSEYHHLTDLSIQYYGASFEVANKSTVALVTFSYQLQVIYDNGKLG